METTLSKDVQEKLDMINWDGLKDKYGISPETFYNSQHLASQLVYGQMTDLVFASREESRREFLEIVDYARQVKRQLQ